MNDFVKPRNGWMIVCKCEHPFTHHASPIIHDKVTGQTNLKWSRVIASSHADYKTGDLVCVKAGQGEDNLFMNGDMCFGSVHSSQVQHSIDAENARNVKDILSTADAIAAEMDLMQQQNMQQMAMGQALQNRLNGNGIVVPKKKVIN